MTKQTAIISTDQKYRYVLTRPSELSHPGAGSALFVMLNPSTADAVLDDPTIRRCRSFAKAWMCAGLVVANLYALRSKSPKDLWRDPDPVGPDNDKHLLYLAKEFGDVVCAWGANAKQDRISEVTAIFKSAGARMWCLGTTKNGSPRHPLYVPSSQKPVRWLPPSAH